MMSNQFVGEIRPFGFNFAPTGWALCAGQLLPISQNTALFSLIGTYYGGNGTSTFALPNLQGSIPLGQGQGPGLSNYVIGEQGGSPNVTLLSSELPGHTHTLPVANAISSKTGTPGPGVYLGPTGSRTTAEPAYNTAAEVTGGFVNMLNTAVQPAGGNVPHNNMGPYLVINYCIALQGIFPARS
jgi:microcystin-dependent protein